MERQYPILRCNGCGEVIIFIDNTHLENQRHVKCDGCGIWKRNTETSLTDHKVHYGFGSSGTEPELTTDEKQASPLRVSSSSYKPGLFGSRSAGLRTKSRKYLRSRPPMPSRTISISNPRRIDGSKNSGPDQLRYSSTPQVDRGSGRSTHSGRKASGFEPPPSHSRKEPAGPVKKGGEDNPRLRMTTSLMEISNQPTTNRSMERSATSQLRQASPSEEHEPNAKTGFKRKPGVARLFGAYGTDVRETRPGLDAFIALPIAEKLRVCREGYKRRMTDSNEQSQPAQDHQHSANKVSGEATSLQTDSLGVTRLGSERLNIEDRMSPSRDAAKSLPGLTEFQASYGREDEGDLGSTQETQDQC